MSKISNSGNGGSSNRTSSTGSTKKASSTPAPKPKTKPSPSKPTGDGTTLSREKGKAGAVPDFSQSFGAKPPATMRQGSKGDNVKQLQEMLNAKGAKLDVDGKYGAKTEQAVKEFQKQQKIESDGIAGKDTMGKLQPQEAASPATQPKADPLEAKPAAADKPTGPGTGKALDLPPGYESLEKLSKSLADKDPRFSTQTPEGRSATALALAIGGTEMYGKGRTATDFFTSKGGTGNNMLGFGQFNQKYHSGKTKTPEKYTKFMGDILTGDARMPNSKPASNHVKALTEAVKSGRIKDGQDLRNFMTQRGFGGSNWQGIDDGWGRNPGLANSLVSFLRQGAS
ncbi:peptidoglycan-binding protein [bacterium]|nr:peptidoglycan-binding protein [bacterium]